MARQPECFLVKIDGQFLCGSTRPDLSAHCKFTLIEKKNSITHSHLSNKPGGWNKRGGGTKFAKSLNMEVGINVKGWILWKKLMHNSNKRGVEGGKNLRNQ